MKKTDFTPEEQKVLDEVKKIDNRPGVVFAKWSQKFRQGDEKPSKSELINSPRLSDVTPKKEQMKSVIINEQGVKKELLVGVDISRDNKKDNFGKVRNPYGEDAYNRGLEAFGE